MTNSYKPPPKGKKPPPPPPPPPKKRTLKEKFAEFNIGLNKTAVRLTSKTIACPACGGAGKITRYYDGLPYIDACRSCYGSGRYTI